jgi:thioredoxin 1
MFSAPWCGNCKMVHPKYSKLAKELTDATIVFCKFDTAQMEELAVDLDVSALPTFKVYKSGTCVATYMGSKWEKVKRILYIRPRYVRRSSDGMSIDWTESREDSFSYRVISRQLPNSVSRRCSYFFSFSRLKKRFVFTSCNVSSGVGILLFCRREMYDIKVSQNTLTLIDCCSIFDICIIDLASERFNDDGEESTATTSANYTTTGHTSSCIMSCIDCDTYIYSETQRL